SDLMREGISFNIDLSHLNLDNYIYIFTQAPEYWSWYGNSLVISAITIVLSLFFSSMVGYALALYDFKGRNLFFVIVLLILLITFEILMLLLYQLMIIIQLINTYISDVLPTIVATVAVFFCRQYDLGLPKDLLAAARLKGCNEYTIFS